MVVIMINHGSDYDQPWQALWSTMAGIMINHGTVITVNHGGDYDQPW
jgi:hypothetical protein